MDLQNIAAIITGSVTVTVVLLKSWDFLISRFNKNSDHIQSIKARLAILESKLEADVEAAPGALSRLINIETNIAEIKEAIANINGRLAQ